MWTQHKTLIILTVAFLVVAILVGVTDDPKQDQADKACETEATNAVFEAYELNDEGLMLRPDWQSGYEFAVGTGVSGARAVPTGNGQYRCSGQWVVKRAVNVLPPGQASPQKISFEWIYDGDTKAVSPNNTEARTYWHRK